MKYLFTVTFFVFLLVTNSYSQTQVEMNAEAAEEYKKADSLLNRVYRDIIKKYTDDPVFIKALRTSQRNWITFRDSELNMKYPDREPDQYGSIHPMCVAYYLAKLTNERTQTLRTWLDGTEMGDACAGSAWSER